VKATIHSWGISWATLLPGEPTSATLSRRVCHAVLLVKHKLEDDSTYNDLVAMLQGNGRAYL